MARRQMGYVVAPGKDAFAALIEEAARRLELVNPDGTADVYELAERAGLRSRSTLYNALTIRDRGVGYGTLLALASVSGRPLSEWAASVGKDVPVAASDAGADADLTPVDPATLDPLTRDIARLVQQYAPTPREKARVRALVRGYLRVDDPQDPDAPDEPDAPGA